VTYATISLYSEITPNLSVERTATNAFGSVAPLGNRGFRRWLAARHIGLVNDRE
jgi:hypothetical protein